MQSGCFRYHKGTDFQANHNWLIIVVKMAAVVLDTTKVQIFKQITTSKEEYIKVKKLFQIPQRYRFSSKSQRGESGEKFKQSCFRYHKGTDFQANHNSFPMPQFSYQLFQIPQRYRFSSKSQRTGEVQKIFSSCFRYHKGTDFQANHNWYGEYKKGRDVVLDTTKVQIFKQITTNLFFT